MQHARYGHHELEHDNFKKSARKNLESRIEVRWRGGNWKSVADFLAGPKNLNESGGPKFFPELSQATQRPLGAPL